MQRQLPKQVARNRRAPAPDDPTGLVKEQDLVLPPVSDSGRVSNAFRGSRRKRIGQG